MVHVYNTLFGCKFNFLGISRVPATHPPRTTVQALVSRNRLKGFAIKPFDFCTNIAASLLHIHFFSVSVETVCCTRPPFVKCSRYILALTTTPRPRRRPSPHPYPAVIPGTRLRGNGILDPWTFRGAYKQNVYDFSVGIHESDILINPLKSICFATLIRCNVKTLSTKILLLFYLNSKCPF